MEAHRPGGRAAAGRGDHLRPQQPRRPQLGDPAEEIAADREGEVELPSRGLELETRGYSTPVAVANASSWAGVAPAS